MITKENTIHNEFLQDCIDWTSLHYRVQPNKEKNPSAILLFVWLRNKYRSRLFLSLDMMNFWFIDRQKFVQTKERLKLKEYFVICQSNYRMDMSIELNERRILFLKDIRCVFDHWLTMKTMNISFLPFQFFSANWMHYSIRQNKTICSLECRSKVFHSNQ